MKKNFAVIAVTAVILSAASVAVAQTNSLAASNFISQAKASGDSQLDSLATLLAEKVGKLKASAGTNAVVSEKSDAVLKSLSTGKDSEALNSSYDLAKSAKLTPQQVDIAKQVGNVASAYVVQKNFSSLQGSKSDVATIVTSLRDGKVAAAVHPLKNVATNASLTDPQKQIVSKIADKYAPGWKKAGEALDTIKKLPGF